MQFGDALTVTVSAGAIITDINGTLENVPPASTTSGLSGRCSAQYDPEHGPIRPAQPRRRPMRIRSDHPAGLVICPDGGLLLTGNALIQGILFDLTE